MGRPREFDTDIVTDRALNLFWRVGYECTSLVDLERETGVGRRGLYNTFGSKHGLFLEALRRYEAQSVELILEPLESQGAGRTEIEDFFLMLTSQEGQLKGNRGCLFCLTADSEVAGAAEVAERVNGYFQRLRQGFVQALRSAQTAGDLGAEKNSEVLADYLVGTVMGLSAMARAGRPRTQIMHYIDTVLATLD